MPNLQMHQIRTAAVAWVISESLSIEVDRDSIVKACLLHDIGNIIKFKIGQIPGSCDPEGLDYWQKVKYDYILKYGNNEHKASLLIAKELGVTDKVYGLVGCVDSSAVETISIGDSFEEKICIYADNRVTPHGIVSIEDRSLEAKERYKDHSHAFNEEKRKFFMDNMFSIEKQIFSHCSIKPQDINDESVKEYIEKLIDFSI